LLTRLVIYIKMVNHLNQFNFKQFYVKIKMNLILKDIVHRDLKLENILIKEFDANSDTFLIKVDHY
jgi:serine/threonine protein kinase